MYPTGERIIPDYPGSHLSLQEHLCRYSLAKKYAENRTILDAGCGVGYGSYFLSQISHHVVGIDISLEAITYATSKYHKQNLHFLIADVTNLPFGNESFDVVCSFEVIEHIQDYRKYLHEITRVLMSDGFLILSTPNALCSSGRNPFHVKEFTPEEIRQELLIYFNNVYILGQSPKCSVINLSKVRRAVKLGFKFFKRLDYFGLRKIVPDKLRYKIDSEIENHLVGIGSRLCRYKSPVRITIDDFQVLENGIEKAPVIIVICQGIVKL